MRGLTRLRTPAETRVIRPLVEPDCPTCGDRGWVLNGPYDTPCPDCHLVCPKCGNQGSFLVDPENPDIPKQDWIMAYCDCAVGAELERSVFEKKYKAARLPDEYQARTFETFVGVLNATPGLWDGKENAFYAARLWAEAALAGATPAESCWVEWSDVLALRELTTEDSDRRNWIVLWGKHGRGKTGLMAAAMNWMMAMGLPVRYIRAMHLIEAIQGRYGDEDAKIPKDEFGLMSADQVLQTVKECPFLFLDEFDMPDALSPDKQAIIEAVMRHRHGYWLPTFITTNLDYSALEYRWGTTTVSVIGQRAHFIQMAGLTLRAQPRLGA